MEKLIQQLIDQGYLRTPAVIKAFRKINRRDFLPDDLVNEESINAPLPIGHGQTISQPLTVAFIIELLQVQEGNYVLDVGAGSGWTTAILAEIVGPSGKVFAIERISALKEFGENNVKKYNFKNIEFFCQDGTKGLPKYAPFDRILVSAAAFEMPEELKAQMEIGGLMVIPSVNQDVRLIKKVELKKFEQTIYPGFVFVPLIED